MCHVVSLYFFFNDTATTEIYTLSLHDALPIWSAWDRRIPSRQTRSAPRRTGPDAHPGLRGPVAALPVLGCAADRKSTRLNSSHANISYAVFCLKKKKTKLSRTSTHMPISSATF